MFSSTDSTDRRSRPTSFAVTTALIGLALALGTLAPDGARAQEHRHETSTDTSVVARLESATSHLEQMLGTLRDNPSLEEEWSSPAVLEAAVVSGRRSVGVARELGALSAAVDSLLEGEAAGGNERLADDLRQIRETAETMTSSLRSVAARLEDLRSVAHGEDGGGGHAAGGGGGHSHGGGPGAGHHAGLHFAHPMFTESVSPDTKIRADYSYLDAGGGEGTKHEFALGVEYALSRSVSVAAGVPYSASDAALGFTRVSLKFVNYALEGHGISLGYGVGVGLPTSGDAPEESGHGGEDGGHGHGVRGARSAAMDAPPAGRAHGGTGVHATLGRDFYEFRPFFNVGWTSGRWELVGFTTFGIPSGLADQHQLGTDLSWDVSALFRAAPEVQTVLELNGSAGLSGHPVGQDVVNLSPGIKLRPSGDSPAWLAVGGSLPLTADQGYDGLLRVSFFYHFR